MSLRIFTASERPHRRVCLNLNKRVLPIVCNRGTLRIKRVGDQRDTVDIAGLVDEVINCFFVSGDIRVRRGEKYLFGCARSLGESLGQDLQAGHRLSFGDLESARQINAEESNGNSECSKKSYPDGKRPLRMVCAPAAYTVKKGGHVWSFQ